MIKTIKKVLVITTAIIATIVYGLTIPMGLIGELIPMGLITKLFM
jgi:hypothetical protein